LHTRLHDAIIFVHFPSKIINTVILWRHLHNGDPYADAGTLRVQKCLVVRTWSTLGLARFMKDHERSWKCWHLLTASDNTVPAWNSAAHFCTSSQACSLCSFSSTNWRCLRPKQEVFSEVRDEEIKKQWYSQTRVHRQWLFTLAATQSQDLQTYRSWLSFAFWGSFLPFLLVDVILDGVVPRKVACLQQLLCETRLRQSTIASCLANKKRQVMYTSSHLFCTTLVTSLAASALFLFLCC
jgi:hypothetical protein